MLIYREKYICDDVTQYFSSLAFKEQRETCRQHVWQLSRSQVTRSTRSSAHCSESALFRLPPMPRVAFLDLTYSSPGQIRVILPTIVVLVMVLHIHKWRAEVRRPFRYICLTRLNATRRWKVGYCTITAGRCCYQVHLKDFKLGGFFFKR